jgi:hypothetical protein
MSLGIELIEGVIMVVAPYIVVGIFMRRAQTQVRARATERDLTFEVLGRGISSSA